MVLVILKKKQYEVCGIGNVRLKCKLEFLLAYVQIIAGLSVLLVRNDTAVAFQTRTNREKQYSGINTYAEHA